MATYAGKLNVGGNELPIGSTLYGTCSTGASTAAKVVTCSNFDKLLTGVTIHVKFTYSNANSSPTLNVNSTGAKNIYRYGTTEPGTTSKTSWNAGAVVSFTYDGSYWQMNDWLNDDSTYTASSTTPSMDGTGAVGTSTDYARADHVHPSDTSRVPTTRTVNSKALSADISLSASDVGAIASSLKGAASGVAELDSSGKVPSSQLPSYVDDVLEYSSQSSFPSTGETGKIYVDTSTNTTYRWSGTAYVEISPSLALGETSSTAYRGDRGATAYSHATDSSRLTTAKTSGLYKVAVTAEGHVASATAVEKSDITALGIPGSVPTDVSAFTNDSGYQTSTQVSTAISAQAGKLIPYGYCQTAADTVAKTVTVSPTVTELTTGLTIAVKFQYANTGSNPTLNVNSLGAKSIKRYGTTAAGTSAAANWNANAVVMLTYDGTYWMLNDWNNTTYSGMSDAEYQAGTSTTNRLITPARLKAAIELHAPVTSVNGSTGAVTVTVPDPSSSSPVMDGTGAVGTSTDYARADHVHPSDTSRVATSSVGVASGVAGLDSSGKVPYAQLPAFTGAAYDYDDTTYTLEFTEETELPADFSPITTLEIDSIVNS